MAVAALAWLGVLAGAVLFWLAVFALIIRF
jgi:hypothetical protein